MDYEKYIELYRQGKFSEAIAYKASQIPTRLVKYYSLNENKKINESKIQYLKENKIFFGAHGPNFSGSSKYFVITLTLFLALSCPTISERSIFDLILVSLLFCFNSSVISLIFVFSDIIELFGFAFIISKP